MKQNGNKGFTLIELLVVIAIIGILASVVLASLNSARAKGKDAAIKAQLSSMRAEMELYFDSQSNSYTGGCASTGTPPAPGKLYNAAKAQSPNPSGATCVSVTAAPLMWAASVPLNNTTNGANYCVDSTGYAGYGIVTLGIGISQAPVCTP